MILLDFEQNRIYFHFKVTRDLVQKKARVIVYANKSSDASLKKIVNYYNYTIQKEEDSYYFDIDYITYDKIAKKFQGGSNLPTQIDISMQLNIFLNDDKKEIKSLESDFCRVHFVRYIPKLMNMKKWYKGEALQKKWFTGKANENYKLGDPDMHTISWKWLTDNSSEIKGEFEDFLSDLKVSFSPYKRRNDVRREIEHMIKDGRCSLPTESNPIVRFGVNESSVITYKNENKPLFDVYYTEYKKFDLIDLMQHYSNTEFNDFVASIAKFNYHVYVTGILEFEKGNFLFNDSINVLIKEFVFYIYDRFDYANEKGEDEALGLWKIIENNAGNHEVKVVLPQLTNDKSTYYEVTNNCFNDYRKDHGMGYDFPVYSTRHSEYWNFTFKL